MEMDCRCGAGGPPGVGGGRFLASSRPGRMLPVVEKKEADQKEKGFIMPAEEQRLSLGLRQRNLSSARGWRLMPLQKPSVMKLAEAALDRATGDGS